MDGKKVALIFIGIILIVAVIIVIAMQVFFAIYEPKETTKVIQNFIQLTLNTL